jgi:hypothetical protein
MKLPCVEHIGTRTRKGYGMVTAEGRQWSAHRLAWTKAFGPIPPGLFVCHHCDNPPCIEPSHLFLGTHQDNMADRNRKGRQAKGDRAGPRLRIETRPRGEAHSLAKLTADAVLRMREAHRAGVSFGALARQFGVDRTTAADDIKGATWRHI